jgi:hypothetical protein
MKVEALLLAKKHGFSAEQIRFSDKLEWIDHNGRMLLRKVRIEPKTGQITIFTNAIEANFPKDSTARALGVLATAIRTLGNGQWDEEEHPRDEDGKFTFSGGGGADAAPKPQEPELDPDVVDVEGDEWNRQTAIRLEKEYQNVKAELDALLHKNVGEEVDTVGEVDEDELNENAPYVPDHWEGLSSDQQEQVKEKYIADNKESWVDSEINNWMDSGQALDEAKQQVARELNDGDETEWAADAIKDWMDGRAENGERVPYSSETILSAVQVSYQDGYGGAGKFEVEFDSDKLSSPIGYDPDQQLLPGIEAIHPSSYLSVEMRDELGSALSDAFDERADDVKDKLEPPDYFSDSAEEALSEDWEYGVDDDFKWNYAQNNTDIVNEAQQEYDEYFANNGNSGGSTEIAIPDKFDPLQETGGTDYKKTHALVTFMSQRRAVQVLRQRDLIPDDAETEVNEYMNDVRAIDKQLWSDWKESSAGSFGGQILQLASHEELGARYREMPTPRADLIKQANTKYKAIGGYDGVKALVRAKWETSQYALDKAGIDTLSVYRGLKVQMPDSEPRQSIEAADQRVYIRYTERQITRNGAYSTTTERGVANGWSAGSGTKVVLRIDAPRTAVLSFPAYGINVHSEKEVVLAGTAFKSWDAWQGEAPSVDLVPIQRSKAA